VSIDSRALFNVLTGYAASSGLFDSVTGHEPKAAPSPTGVSASIWWAGTEPILSSGVNSVSVRVEFQCRVYTTMLQEPQDDIDPRIMDAVDVMFTALIGDFDFGSQARYVDVLGSDGERLRAVPGYLTQDSKVFRVADIFVPVLVNDAYAEVA